MKKQKFGQGKKNISAKLVCFLSLTVLFAVTLSGCADIDSDPYGKWMVLRKVSSEVTGEKYTLVSVEQIAEKPADVEYTFTSDERDLQFTANSYVGNIWIDTPTNLYYRGITCHYEEAVFDFYTEKIESFEQKSPDRYKEGWNYITSFAEIEALSRNIFALSDLLSAELAYNDEAFLSESVARSINVYWGTDPETAVRFCSVALDGLTSENEIYDFIADNYAQSIASGDIPDTGDVSDEYLDSMHVSRLEHFYLNGNEMTYDTLENPFGSAGLTTDDYKKSWYDFDKNSYMMIIDTGYYTDNSSFPLIIAEYVEALGGSWQMTGNGTKTDSGLEWTIGEYRWELESTRLSDDPYFKNLTIQKNGEPMDVTYATLADASDIGATFCVAIPVEQFAALFNLDYKIDEASASIYFTEKSD